MPSEKILEQKKIEVSNLSKRLQNSCTGVVVSYKGISVEEDTKLRKNLREAGINYTVVKNTLLSRAASQSGLEGLQSALQGTTALATSETDYVAAAKILCEFAKENNFFEIKAGFIDGEIVDAAVIESLSKLPSKEVLYAKMLGGLNSPISGFVTVLNGALKSLAVVLNAIVQKKSA